MKNFSTFEYPNDLKIIFDKLNKNEIKVIIVGGYIRDFFLNIVSKDIDVELYGIYSFETLENILKEFGEINSVGKNFGVCKLSLKTLEIDFTLPRKDNKIASGHTGFSIEVDNTLTFYEASLRRDFTINAIGYDVVEKKFLDPFHGIGDIQNKILQAVSLKKFSQDPLRVLRLVGFASRFHFSIEKKLFNLSKEMCDAKILFELPQERIYTELQKILLKSPQPSEAFLLLAALNALQYLSPLDALKERDFLKVLKALDALAKMNIENNHVKFMLMLCVLCCEFDAKETTHFIQNLTTHKSLLKNVLLILENEFSPHLSNSQLYKLASRVNIEYFLLFSQAIHPQINTEVFAELKKRATSLGILNKKAPPLLQGRDLLTHNIQPSKQYAQILSLAYDAQMNLEITNHKEAKIWLKNYLDNTPIF